jgi:hypothetical protein
MFHGSVEIGYELAKVRCLLGKYPAGNHKSHISLSSKNSLNIAKVPSFKQEGL